MSYTIIQADLKNHKKDIISLWRRNSQGVPEERYSWIYENNPAGAPICYLLKENESGSIVGATSLFPRKIFIDGKQINAGIAGDFVVDKNHRALGPALSLQKAAVFHCNGNEFAILYGFPNKQSESVLLRAGYKILGEVVQMTKPLHSYYYIKRYINIPVITKALSNALDFLMKNHPKEIYKKTSNQYSFIILSSFNQTFDVLWDKASTRFIFIGERNSSYLNWRYKESPHNKHNIFALISKDDSKIFGYIIFSLTENRAQIADILFQKDDILDTLISSFINMQRRQGVDSISINIAGNRSFVDKLKEYGFSLRSRERKILIYTSSNFLIPLPEIENGNWYLTSGDNDI